MALVVFDRVQQTGTANTTVSFTLSGSVTGYQSFSVVGNGNTTFYGATDTSGNWEVGVGTYATGGTLTRTTILASSNSGSAVTFSGTVNVFVTYPAEKSVNLDASGNVSPLGTITSAVWNGTTIPVAYGGTGVTTSSGASSVVLRDTNVNISANNTFNAYTAVTAAGGTTTMTAASTYYQKLVAGSGNQTFKLPDATTLPNGATYIFDNDSTGNLIIQDSTGGAIDTIPTGALDYIYLESNSTAAGSWGQYAFIPAAYDFSTTTASFGGANITNATYQANTVQPAYGGTGLTTFTAANNAIYSTSSSALTAGTLPVVAGGTGVTTSTGSGSVVLNTSPSLVTPALGTPSSGNLANCTGYPAGSISGTINLTTQVTGTLPVANGGTGATTLTGYVSGNGTGAFTASSTIPGSAISGNISGNAANVTGTVAIANGGTGATTASAGFNNLSPITTTGDLIIGNGTNSATRLGIGSANYVLTSNGTTATWSAPAGSSTLNTAEFTATASQTTFTISGGYTVGLIDGVYRNGIKLGTADYTASNGTTVVLSTGAVSGDLIQVVYFTAVAVSTVVNTINFGSTGLTPSTATSGAVTVGGTLAASNGGTGLTSPGTSGNVLTSNGTGWVSSAPTGATVTPTTSNTTYYVVGSSSTSGSLSAAYVSNTNAVSYNASTGALTAVSMVSSSDERLKSNIQTLTNAVQTVENLRGVSYLRNDRPEIGVIAQEVEKVLPMLVHEDEEGYKSVAYGNMVGLLIEAVKELSAEVKALKAELNK